MNEDKNKSQTPTFEEAYQRLEAIARELEDGNTSLECSFTLYEEGQKLLRLCHNLLDNAEKRLKVLTEVDGEFETTETTID